MSKPIIKIVDVSTGEEVEREMTKGEYDQYLANQVEAEAQAQAEAETEAARQSALEKLAALGLTEAEIQALAG